MSDSAKYARYAERIRLFNGLKPQEVSDILHKGSPISYRQGLTIFHEGMLGSNLFIILHGSVGLYKKNKLIARCEPGDAFGEMSVLSHTPRNATALAETDVKLFTLDENQVNEILERHVAVKFLLNIIHVLSERLEEANTWRSDLRKTRK